MKNKTIEKAISICGSQLRLAQECGVSQVSVSFWLFRHVTHIVRIRKSNK
ncbi:helix-turn-helix domain-containing protein [Pasteurella multocida]|nr:YdaS family helix-turn-helix protein [Pasteurella multocida]MBF6979490.1 helix-turn-helix domain-containing protein [Pasteurella multocida]MDA5611818.1 helix-turn-helix domain-containing protein [Pasteurella multocida]MDA5614288.1 helix-turn-helix domain-containing protein [Pasteurella multocida]MDA5621914.1 helix-turn-helix domain-containing protein [Pasteurella multocida subsp. multocida]